MQLRINKNGRQIWKCKMFLMCVDGAINALETIEESYPNWVTEFNKEIKNLNDKIANIEIPQFDMTKMNRLQIIEMIEGEVTILPNLYYVWGEIEELSITLGELNNDGYTDEYCFEFRSGAIPTTLIFDNNIKWVSEPNIEANKTYQVSILNGVGVIIGV